MTHHVEHDTIVIGRVAYREACELRSLRIETGSKNHISFSFAPYSLNEEPKLESDAVLSLVTIAHA